jgi:hypothetical protein
VVIGGNVTVVRFSVISPKATNRSRSCLNAGHGFGGLRIDGVPNSGSAVKVDAKVASTLSPVAYVFYAPLPERSTVSKMLWSAVKLRPRAANRRGVLHRRLPARKARVAARSEGFAAM